MTHDEFQKKVMKLARRECSPSEAGMIALDLMLESSRLRIAAGMQPATNDQKPTTKDQNAERS